MAGDTLDEPGLLFPGQRGEGLSPSGSPCPFVPPYICQEPDLHRAGLKQVARLLGRSNLNTAQIYITTGECDLELGVEMLAR